MAIQLIDGFDHYNSTALANLKGWVISNVGWGATGGRLGGAAVSLTGNGTNSNTISGTKILPSNYSTLVAGFAFQWNSTANDNAIFSFQQSGGTIATLLLPVASKILTVQNSSGSTIATGTTPLIQNVWYYIEFKLSINGASGTCEVRLNGAPGEIASTVGNFGSTNCDRVQISVKSNNAGSAFSSLFDDLYVLDTSGSSPRNTFLGDTRVETLYPNGDGAHSAWTPNSGTTHFNRVNDNPPDGDTSYVSDSTPGDIDTYTMDDLATLTGTIFGVQTNLYARKDDANTRTIAPVIRLAGTDYAGPTAPALSTSYVYYSQIYNQDPTGTDWTIPSVNAAEVGVKEVS